MDKYEKRELEIIDKLKQGKSREEISIDYDYSTWKSLDIFMRRRGYIWRGDKNIYELETTNIDNIRDELISGISIKAEQVVNRIDNGEDPRDLAKSLGFSDHREMGEYMEEEGLSWDSELGNYIESEGEISHAKGRNTNLESTTGNLEARLETESMDINLAGIEKYIPILELLYEHRDSLSELLLNNDSNDVPNYIIPGAAKAKTIYMSDKLGRLLADFTSKNGGSISQRSVVETGIIMYLKKYGGSYKKDVEMLLNKK